jgi:Ni/Fe-hydrogenase subunit HybB-like protein
MKKINILALSMFTLLAPAVYAADVGSGLGFTVPNLANVISFMIRFLFFFAGLAALLYLLLGAMSWVTSSGDKENVKKAQDKIQAAVVGLVILVAVLVIIATMEQLVLKGAFCVGLTDCNVQNSIPKLLN